MIRKKALYDILQAARDIEKYTAGMDWDAFRTHGMAQAAVERKFEILGEALSRISRTEPSVLQWISNYRRIIGFRNIIAHGYDIVDIEIVWDVVKGHVPVLVREVEHLLNE